MKIMTEAQQKKILKDHVLKFLQHQVEANRHLQEIVSIGLLENEGNPLRSRIMGEDHLRSICGGIFQPGEIDEVLEEAKRIQEASGWII